MLPDISGATEPYNTWQRCRAVVKHKERHVIYQAACISWISLAGLYTSCHVYVDIYIKLQEQNHPINNTSRRPLPTTETALIFLKQSF